MSPKHLSSPTASRLLALAITATSSVAAPPGGANWNAITIGLGCLCVVLVAFIVVLWTTRRREPIERPAALVVPGSSEIVKYSRDAIFVIQESGEILSTNPAAEKLFGYPFSELRGKSIAALVPPPARGRRRTNYIHAAEGRELIGVRRSGEQFPLDLVLSELPGYAEKRFSVIVRDRSERNKAEEEIDSQRRFASALLDQLPALLVVIDHDGRLVRFNRTCEELTRFSEGELRGQYLWQAVAAPAAMREAEQQILDLLAGEFPAESTTEWCLRDNSTRLIAWRHNALRDEYGRLTHVVSTGTDVTYTRQWEERRREEQSLATAGRLAGGIAHDFNNLLTAITGYSGLALAGLDEKDPVRGDVEEIKRAGDRGASITRQLLAFSGNHPRNARPVSCNDAVKNVERLVRVMAGEGIHVDLSLEADLPRAVADPQLIEECIMHLVANAKEAMPNGGTLQIQTGVRTLNRTRLDAHPALGPGEYVTLSVVDTGAGIAPEALPHIFEPFYTTKNSPVSNGMGLAIVYGIVRQAGGSIVVHSAPKYGSTFRIFLPLAPEEARQRPEPLSEEALHGDETVLLAMEADGDRQRLREVLDSAGYTVLEARSGLQALEMAHKSTGIIHLLLTDITLPRMTGPALAGSIQDRVPAIRVLYATSRGAEEIERHGLIPESVLRLDRTFDRRFVLQRVRETLAAGSRQ